MIKKMVKNGIAIWAEKAFLNCMLNLLFISPGVGALFSSCMREDYKLMLEISKKNYSSSAVLGCCEVAIRNTAGTMTQEECDQETGGSVNSISKNTELITHLLLWNLDMYICSIYTVQNNCAISL